MNRTVRDFAYASYYSIISVFIVSLLSYGYNQAFNYIFADHVNYMDKLEANINAATSAKKSANLISLDVFYVYLELIASMIADIVSILVIMYANRMIISRFTLFNAEQKYLNKFLNISGTTSVFTATIIFVYFSFAQKTQLMKQMFDLDTRTVFIPTAFVFAGLFGYLSFIRRF